MCPPSRNPQCVSVKHTISGLCSRIRLLISVVLHGAEAQLTFQLTTITASLRYRFTSCFLAIQLRASGCPSFSKYSRVTRNTIGASNSNPMKFGTAISPLSVSESFHTKSTFTKHLIVLQGGVGAKRRREALAALAAIPEGEELLVLATSRYIGEGFDDARLDTLLLTMPVSWRGTIVQYTGRLHRLHPGKTEVWIDDYVDRRVPVLARMYERRLRGVGQLGMSALTNPVCRLTGFGTHPAGDRPTTAPCETYERERSVIKPNASDFKQRRPEAYRWRAANGIQAMPTRVPRPSAYVFEPQVANGVTSPFSSPAPSIASDYSERLLPPRTDILYYYNPKGSQKTVAVNSTIVFSSDMKKFIECVTFVL